MEFIVGKIYFGGLLTLAHSQMKLQCVKRTKHFVWLAETHVFNSVSKTQVHKCKVLKDINNNEKCRCDGFCVSSDTVDKSVDMQWV